MGKASLLILSLPESIRTPSSFFCFPSGFSRGSFLGGTCYIHLTKRTNAVFSGFFSSPGYGCHIYESNTKWWISIVTYFDIQVNPYWNRTLTYHFLTSVGVNHGWTLGGYCYIHLTTRTNAVFSSFSACFGYGDLLYELNHFCDESSVFLFRHFYMPQFKSNS